MAARSLNDFCNLVFGGVLIKGNENREIRQDRLLLMRRRLTEDHFTDPTMKIMFRVICYYDDVTGDVIGAQALEDKLEGASDQGTAEYLKEQYRAWSNLDVPEDLYKFAIEQVRDKKAEKETALALEYTMEILRHGVEVKGETIRGQEKAREYVIRELARIDRDLSIQDSPESNLNSDTEEMWREYQKAEELIASGTIGGVRTGIDQLDEILAGMNPGELNLTLGYTSSGKTTACVQIAWWAAVMQGFNVIYATTETHLTQVRQRLVARHSCLPDFGYSVDADESGRLLPTGLNSKDIRLGRLTPEQKNIYRNVLDDLHKNPNYGKIDVIQMPRGGTLADLDLRASRIAKDRKITLIVADYLQLWHGMDKRQTERETYASVLRDGKDFANGFQDGQGCVLLSPWQVNRDGLAKSSVLNQFTLESTSGTAEASNIADSVISIYDPNVHLSTKKNRITELDLAVIKQRAGDTSDGFKVDVDYATSRFGQVKGGGFTPFNAGLSTLG